MTGFRDELEGELESQRQYSLIKEELTRGKTMTWWRFEVKKTSALLKSGVSAMDMRLLTNKLSDHFRTVWFRADRISKWGPICFVRAPTEKQAVALVNSAIARRERRRVKGPLAFAAKQKVKLEVEKKPKTPVCSTCNDDHAYSFETDNGQMVRRLCSDCPIPCKECQRGAYCETTPCFCECHESKKPERMTIVIDRLGGEVVAELGTFKVIQFENGYVEFCGPGLPPGRVMKGLEKRHASHIVMMLHSAYYAGIARRRVR